MKIQKSTTRYICEFCRKSYSSKTRAEACEAACKLENEKALEARIKSQKELEEFFNSGSVSEIAQKIADYINAESSKKCKVVFKVNPNEHCSNSHSAPFGKKTNWGNYNRDPKIPTGYLGLVGNLSIIIEGGYSGDICKSFNDIRYKYRIHTGTGGARSYGLGWNVTLWADDFPVIKQKLKKYFELTKQHTAWKFDCGRIDQDYDLAQEKFVSNDETYLAKKEALQRAEIELQEAKQNALQVFVDSNPKPTSKLKKVTNEDLVEQRQSFL